MQYTEVTEHLQRPESVEIDNMELNDMRKIICLRKSEISFEKISICNVTEKLEKQIEKK